MTQSSTPDPDCDYIIVGAGSAGCTLANRLSVGGAKVVLLEAGPKDWHPMIHIPAGVLKLLYNSSVNWMYASDPEPGTGNRAIHWPRGRVLGGSSSINGMLFVRGNAKDYDSWAQPCLKTMESLRKSLPIARGLPTTILHWSANSAR